MTFKETFKTFYESYIKNERTSDFIESTWIGENDILKFFFFL